MLFKGDVNFEGRTTFNKDTAGGALIKQTADSVDVIFEKEYIQTPLVNISITVDDLTQYCHPESISGSKEIPDQVRDDVLSVQSDIAKCIQVMTDKRAGIRKSHFRQ